MEQEVTYARLLEIPVDTCTVITKKSKKRTYKKKEERLKDEAIARVNAAQEEDAAMETAGEEVKKQTENQAENAAIPLPQAEEQAGAGIPAEQKEPQIPARFAPLPPTEAVGVTEERTLLPLSAEQGEDATQIPIEAEAPALPVCEILEELPKEGLVREEYFPQRKKRGVLTYLCAGFLAVLSLAFILNAFVFRVDIAGALSGANKKTADTRLRGAFSLVLPTAGAYEIENGVMQLTEKGGVYATEDGTVSSLTKGEDGFYTMEISHSDLFKTVITGVSMPFNEVGEKVYRAQPVAYGAGETISVSFYENGERLSCAVEDGAVKV